ncbi:MAG: YegS/Rv2252/BmrU family lipid kinase [Tissierellia bacterium]|nr:YegS/Rv2252/BmrU family lipid kinase [Tissierellia bacterium]
MKRIKLIINPASGRQSMEKKIDNLCKYLLDDGYILGKFFTEKKYDAMFAAKEACSGDFDLIVACGGDGTVNEVVKGIMTSEKKLPLAILAGGTVNDFANYLEMPKTAVGFYKLIKRNEQVDVDIGKVNDGYFVNVVAGGLLTKIAYQAISDMKAVLGRLAYYLEALKEIASEGLDPVNVKIVSEEFVSEEKILLFVVSNSSSIGGFKKLAPEASILDGLLDVVLIKNADLAELANIFVNVLTGEHIRHPKVTYYKTRELTINSQNNIFIDIDGEFGGELPVHFKVMPKGLKILV